MNEHLYPLLARHDAAPEEELTFDEVRRREELLRGVLAGTRGGSGAGVGAGGRRGWRWARTLRPRRPRVPWPGRALWAGVAVAAVCAAGYGVADLGPGWGGFGEQFTQAAQIPGPVSIDPGCRSGAEGVPHGTDIRAVAAVTYAGSVAEVVLTDGKAYACQTARPGHPDDGLLFSVLAPDPGPLTPDELARGAAWGSSEGSSATIAGFAGWVGADVRSVRLRTGDGMTVTAAVQDGFVMAVWSSPDRSSSPVKAELTLADGSSMTVGLPGR